MGKLLRIRALSETLTPTAPAWSAMPSPTIIAGSSGSYALPVTNATSVTWAGSVAQPAWLTLVAANPPRLTWTAAPAAATIDATCELIATGPGGSVPSGKFGLVVSAATGFFAGWDTGTRTITRESPSESDSGFPRINKQIRWAGHPNGRMFGMMGDYANTGGQIVWSLDPSRWSGDATAPAFKMEAPWWPVSGPQPQSQDCNATAWDSKRRHFWLLGGENYGDGTWFRAKPAGVTAVVNKVFKFYPDAADGSKWVNTGVDMQVQSSWEGSGAGFYDPVLDVAFHSIHDGGYAQIAWWDCSAQVWLGRTRFTRVDMTLGSYPDQMCITIGFDEVQRKVWMRQQWDGLRSNPRGAPPADKLLEVAMPSTRADLPTGGATIEWGGRATLKWSNGSHWIAKRWEGLIRGNDGSRKFGAWLTGTPTTNPASPDWFWTGNGMGLYGHPNFGNGTPNVQTCLLVDVDTGAEETAQLTVTKYDDGQGWVLPNVTVWDERRSTLFYGSEVFEAFPIAGGSYRRTETAWRIARPSPVPSWVASLPANQWYSIPNSNAETNLDAAVRTTWSGAEGSGNGGHSLNRNSNPWNYSNFTLRQRGAALLFHGGGGDTDGSGNGILAFNVNVEVPYWSLPMPPTPLSYTANRLRKTSNGGDTANSVFNSTEYNVTFADPTVESLFPPGATQQKTPVAVHSYRTCIYLDSEDMWLRFGTQAINPTDQAPSYPKAATVFGFRWIETSKAQWSRLWTLNAKATPTADSGYTPLGRAALKHPWTEDVIWGSAAVFHYWRRATNTWRNRVDNYALPDETWAPQFIDPTVNLCVFCPSTPGSAPRVADLDTLDNASVTVSTGSWTGAGAAELAATSVLWAWDDDNACAWALDRATFASLFKVQCSNRATGQFTVTKVTLSGTAPSLPSGSDAMGKTLAWSRELGGLLFNGAYHMPIYFIKTSTKA
jgi:hypothetical protein